MRILFQYFTGGGGGLANIMILLRTLANTYPQDQITVVCSQSSELKQLDSLPNVDVVFFGDGGNQELERLRLGLGGLQEIVRKVRADLVWSLNLGPYLKLNVPHVLSVNNAHQIYPWAVTRYHPKNPIFVAGLRWFFRNTLRVSDGVIVQTPLMGQYVAALSKGRQQIKVLSKAVENTSDVQPLALPAEMQAMISGGLGPKAFTFLYVATAMPHKNHRTLVEAFDLLKASGVNARVLLTITLDELRAMGGEKAVGLVESGHVVPLGWTKKPHLKALYDACDACLMPSVLESLSSTHLEAMQWGKPQIVADLPYARDLCGDAVMYVAAESPEAWGQKIEVFASDQALRQDLTSKGFLRMREFPATWTEVAHQARAFLVRILETHQRS
jgi:glycosyltransferase involved in cell wall biosynthesis